MSSNLESELIRATRAARGTIFVIFADTIIA